MGACAKLHKARQNQQGPLCQCSCFKSVRFWTKWQRKGGDQAYNQLPSASNAGSYGTTTGQAAIQARAVPVQAVVQARAVPVQQSNQPKVLFSSKDFARRNQV